MSKGQKAETGRPASARAREPRPVFGGDRRPGAIELLGSARQREGLQRVEAEPLLVRSQGGQGCRAADMRDPWPGRNRCGGAADRRIRHAEEDQIGLRPGGREAPLHQPRVDGGSHTAATDDPDLRKHACLQFILPRAGLKTWSALNRRPPRHRDRGDLASEGQGSVLLVRLCGSCR